ncbi:lon protease [Gammaproteobacteria bacterium]|nr:lon protease [Gammaproteobacteria bacterium]
MNILTIPTSLPRRLPILPLRDIIVFPNMTTPLFVARGQSLAALAFSEHTEGYVILVTQRSIEIDENNADTLYNIGTLARITQKTRHEDGNYKILTESIQRVLISNINVDTSDSELKGMCTGTYKLLESEKDGLLPHNFIGYKNALHSALRDLFSSNDKNFSEEIRHSLLNIDNLERLISVVASHISAPLSAKQNLLEILPLEEQAMMAITLVEAQIDNLELERKIRNRVKEQMDKNHREYTLNEQIKAIHKELDELNGTNFSEIELLRESILAAKMPEKIEAKALAEWKKLKTMPVSSSEGAVIRNYIDWLLKMPWIASMPLKHDLAFSKKRLDQDHFGLEKVKERILDYLAVLKRTPTLKAPIICFVGPPGVGKTTLARSIAASTGREFARISLGGVRDESEIRGHRRTYIGAMPGRIVNALSKLKTKNPLILLDEIDKMGMDNRGDPASALLEVLDVEQNTMFNDHYMDVDLDLSEVMFITTANTMNIPGPLRDRMEIIHLSGYTELEKLDIAKRFLIPKQLSENGLLKKEFKITDPQVLAVIRNYTRESGVRNLERVFATLSRKVVKSLLEDTTQKSISINAKLLAKFLGPAHFKFGESDHKAQIGYVNGLAWTQVGGELLGIEVEIVPGKGGLICTGSLGDVMKESMRTAMTVVRVRSEALGLPYDFHEKWDLHVHAPEGAVPKDGPSAGIAITTAIISALTGNPVKADIAMTGEVTLRGRVLAIGGLKEKLLAAVRGGIKTVLIPAENAKDLVDLPPEVCEQLLIILVASIDEVLENSLTQHIDLKNNSNKFIPINHPQLNVSTPI